MPRIRTIKPEMFCDEKLAPLPPIDRLVFIGLISMADDRGRVLDNAKVIDAFIFPCTDDTSARSIGVLHGLGRIRRGFADNSSKVIQIENWSHQKIDRPHYSGCLSEIAQEIEPQEVADNSTNVRRTFVEPSTTDLLSSTVYPLSSTVYPLSSTVPRERGGVVRAPRQEDPRVEEIVAHYLTHHPRRKPGPKARRAIERALAIYEVADIKAAIDGNAADSWHRERGKHELEYVLREGKIDDFRFRPEPEPLYDEAVHGPPVVDGVPSARMMWLTDPDHPERMLKRA